MCLIWRILKTFLALKTLKEIPGCPWIYLQTMNFFLSFVVSLEHELEPHGQGKCFQFVERTLIVF
jgi:hypothetical protein